MYEPVLTDEKLDLYNVYEVHENYRILAMAVNVPLQVAKEICHILNEFEIKSLQPCPICDQSVTINEYISDYLYSINCECCGLKTRRFRSKQNLIKYWNATKSEQAMCYLQKDVQLCQKWYLSKGKFKRKKFCSSMPWLRYHISFW